MSETIIWKQGDKLDSGRYTIIRELGTGGIGITYLAEDDQYKKVAIKTLNKKSQRANDFEKVCQNFTKEATRLRNCSHPNIVKFENEFHENNLPCIVMEYVEGEKLSDYVKKQGKLSENEALRYIKQISKALITVHEIGLLHLDINPNNIIIRSNTLEAVLIDFGIAKEFIADKTQELTSVAYTRGFAPIEQYSNTGKLGAYTDIYALAATLYYMLIGYAPLSPPGRYADGKFKIDARQDNAEISKAINQLIEIGLILQGKDRPQSINQWLQTIKNTAISSKLKSVAGINYQNLEKQLKSGKWDEADKETTKIIFKLCNPENTDYLLALDFQKIPCPDLDTINQLWLKYSKNRYGFTVQKKIWNHLGNDYIKLEEKWIKFGITIGWHLKIKELSIGWFVNQKGQFKNLLMDAIRVLSNSFGFLMVEGVKMLFDNSVWKNILTVLLLFPMLCCIILASGLSYLLLKVLTIPLWMINYLLDYLIYLFILFLCESGLYKYPLGYYPTLLHPRWELNLDQTADSRFVAKIKIKMEEEKTQKRQNLDEIIATFKQIRSENKNCREEYNTWEERKKSALTKNSLDIVEQCEWNQQNLDHMIKVTERRMNEMSQPIEKRELELRKVEAKLQLIRLAGFQSNIESLFDKLKECDL